jgi:hypothetical protein
LSRAESLTGVVRANAQNRGAGVTPARRNIFKERSNDMGVLRNFAEDIKNAVYDEDDVVYFEFENDEISSHTTNIYSVIGIKNIACGEVKETAEGKLFPLTADIRVTIMARPLNTALQIYDYFDNTVMDKFAGLEWTVKSFKTEEIKYDANYDRKILTAVFVLMANYKGG